MPKDRGYKNRPESFYQPTKESDRTREGQAKANLTGSSAMGGGINDFNYKGKVTSNAGSDYHDLGRKDSGLHGNFSQKDASLEYLRSRNKEGQRVKNYSGTNPTAELRTGAGPTAYDSRPIPEVYKPATSQGQVSPNAVKYNTTEKDRQPDAFYVQNTESNKLPNKIAKHIKSKE